MFKDILNVFTSSGKFNSIKNAILFVKLAIAAYGYFFSWISFNTSILLLLLILFIRFVVMPSDCDFVLSYYDRYGKKVDQLNGKVIWITGASTGIGAGIATALSKGKVKLALSARSEEKLQDVKRRCLKNGLIEDDVLIVPFDMINYDKHEWAFSTVLKHFGKVDVLVSNAGRSQHASWENIDIGVDREIFELNVFSLINLARIVTRHFITVGGGRHVVTSSIAGKLGSPFSSSYAGTKHAINGYFDTLRVERGAKGISINVVCPGPVESDIMQGIIGEKVNEKVGVSRPGEVMSTERCAHLCVVAMANDVKEVWISNQPFLSMVYLNQYLPSVAKWIFHAFDFSKLSVRSSTDSK